MIIYEQINYQDQRFADRYCAPHTGSLQSMGNPYGKPRANPYRLKLQAHPYGNWAFPRTDSRVQQDTLDETLPKYPWYIIYNLPLFEYLYIGFEGTVTALNACLIILQDTSELPMCLRLVDPIPSWYTQVYSQYAVLWLLVLGRQCDFLSPERHLLFPEQGVFGLCRDLRLAGAGGTAQESHQGLAGTSSRDSDNLEKDGQRSCFASSPVRAKEQHQWVQSLRIGLSQLCTAGEWAYSGAGDVRAVSYIQYGLSGLFSYWIQRRDTGRSIIRCLR